MGFLSFFESPLTSGEGNANPLQYSCLGNPMDRGAWWAIFHGVAKRHNGACTNTHTHTDTQTHTQTHIHAHTHIHPHTYTYTHTHTHTHTPTHTYTHKHTHKHTHTHIISWRDMARGHASKTLELDPGFTSSVTSESLSDSPVMRFPHL